MDTAMKPSLATPRKPTITLHMTTFFPGRLENASENVGENVGENAGENASENVDVNVAELESRGDFAWSLLTEIVTHFRGLSDLIDGDLPGIDNGAHVPQTQAACGLALLRDHVVKHDPARLNAFIALESTVRDGADLRIEIIEQA